MICRFFIGPSTLLWTEVLDNNWKLEVDWTVLLCVFLSTSLSHFFWSAHFLHFLFSSSRFTSISFSIKQQILPIQMIVHPHSKTSLQMIDFRDYFNTFLLALIFEGFGFLYDSATFLFFFAVNQHFTFDSVLLLSLYLVQLLIEFLSTRMKRYVLPIALCMVFLPSFPVRRTLIRFLGAGVLGGGAYYHMHYPPDREQYVNSLEDPTPVEMASMTPKQVRFPSVSVSLWPNLAEELQCLLQSYGQSCYWSTLQGPHVFGW